MPETLIIFGAKYLFILPIAAFATYFFFISKDVRIRLGILALISLPFVYVLARIAGLLYSHPQPFAGWEGEPLVPHEIDNAFPSDHTALAAALAAIAYLNNRGLGAALGAVALLIGLSRMSAGLHSALDILASFGIAVVAVWVVSAVVRAR